MTCYMLQKIEEGGRPSPPTPRMDMVPTDRERERERERERDMRTESRKSHGSAAVSRRKVLVFTVIFQEGLIISFRIQFEGNFQLVCHLTEEGSVI